MHPTLCEPLLLHAAELLAALVGAAALFVGWVMMARA
jgi:hypothetical protein